MMPGTPLGAHQIVATFERDKATRTDLDMGTISAIGLTIDVEACNPETVIAAGIRWLEYLMQTTSASPEIAAALEKALECQAYLTRRQQMRLAQ